MSRQLYVVLFHRLFIHATQFTTWTHCAIFFYLHWTFQFNLFFLAKFGLVFGNSLFSFLFKFVSVSYSISFKTKNTEKNHKNNKNIVKFYNETILQTYCNFYQHFVHIVQIKSPKKNVKNMKGFIWTWEIKLQHK